ncbi:MAG: hypothetical protein ABIP44_08550 [Pseudoxanthomonas sp.]
MNALDALPRVEALLGDRGCQADWFGAAPVARKFTACIPSIANRKVAIANDSAPCHQRDTIENMFGRLGDWRSIPDRYDRRAHTLMSAIGIAAAVVFWLGQ